MSLQIESIKIFLENTDDLTVSKIGRWCKNYFNEKKARLAKERLRIEQTHTDIISRQCLNVFYIPLLICDVTIRHPSMKFDAHPSMKFDVYSRLHFKAVLTKISKEEFLEWLTVEMSKKLQTDVISKTNSYIEIINSYIEIISADLNLDSLLF